MRGQLLITEKDHEIGQIAVILSQFSDHQHQIHSEGIPAEVRDNPRVVEAYLGAPTS